MKVGLVLAAPPRAEHASTRNCRRCAKKDVIGRHALDTIVGRKRLDHLQAAVETVLREGVPGDLIELVWRQRFRAS